MQYRMTLMASLVLGTTAYALPARPQITEAPRADQVKRQDGASSVLDAPMTIAAGESFDGGDAIFDRGVDCTGQSEGGSSDAVFILESGASLSNVRIGPNQIEGVHCMGGCTITNVWWDAVCEDAFSIKEQAEGETTTINGGGATGAEDKVIQHNGGGTVIINDFTVSDFGKLYRSCGNCDDMPARHVQVVGGTATDGKMLVGINSNMGDTASISGVSLTGVDAECTDFEGVTDGSEPTEIGPCSGTGSGGGSGGEEGGADEGDSDEGDSGEGDVEEGDGDEGDADEGDADEGDADEGDADEGDADGEEGDDEEADEDEDEDEEEQEDEDEVDDEEEEEVDEEEEEEQDADEDEDEEDEDEED